ncbi:MAG: ActS/PrrB/RegB family redox-sensitive histidine kinase [Geminicoccaceae bacterium]
MSTHPLRGRRPGSALVLRLGSSLRSLAAMFHRDQTHVSLHTLALARWVAIIGQAFTLLLVHFSLDIPLPLAALLPAVGLSALINLALSIGFKATTRLPEPGAFVLHSYDVLQLGYLLALTGGVQNPFALLLMLPVAIAASTLGRVWAVAVTLITLVLIGLLALFPGDLPWRSGGLSLPALYIVGSWTALTIGTVLVAAYAWTVAEDARRRASALAATQLALAREQQLSALGGQAAAAAHLLGSPLSTIAVIAKELVRELPAGSPLTEEAQELLGQAKRCREILQTLGRSPHDPGHERFTRAPLSTLLETLAQEFGRPEVEVSVTTLAVDGTPEPQVVPVPELRHSLANLIDNAIRFARQAVKVTVRPSKAGVTLTIEDDGPGFSPEVLDWLGEPYLSTRSEEGGLGLGIFIAITLLARSGATLHVHNNIRGACVTVTWPPNALERASEETSHERRGR